MMQDNLRRMQKNTADVIKAKVHHEDLVFVAVRVRGEVGKQAAHWEVTAGLKHEAHTDQPMAVEVTFDGALSHGELADAAAKFLTGLVEARHEECEHGLSEWLCAGPNHYPADREGY
jgi:hypothetical protein